MTIAYYEPFNGKRPIVERVPECRPTKGSHKLRVADVIGSMGWFGTITRDIIPEHQDIAAALTRDAIKCWACDLDAPLNSTAAIVHNAIIFQTSHDEVNAAAHALADAMEIAP